jgi:hypothetical protein
MKTVNALNKIKKELGTEATIEQINKVTTKGFVEYKGYRLEFIMNETGDSENFYTSKKDEDNGYNGYNGTFHDRLTQAISYLKLK